ncbi:protein takeout-like [Temnothorax longispinosus]|uniref:protein takeout-like n=1 Tax=Temnothorax longispinosus TaxID=300112 RepID=UPI003A993D70
MQEIFRKMFAAAFALVLITVHVAAEVPSYIHVCGRRDPNLDQCIFNNVENLKDKICEGMPDLNIPSNNPLILDELVIFDSPDNKLYIKDTKMTGLCDFVVNYLHLDIDKLHFDVDLLFKQIQINGTYNLNVRLLVPITNTAQVYITTDNVGAKVSADMKMVTKGNQRYMFFSKMTINLDIKGYNIDFSHERELGQLREIIRNFVGDNQQEIIRVIKPALEESITKRILLVANNIVKLFTYEELFPDRT